MRASQDKFNETKYYFWKVDSKLNEILNTEDIRKIPEIISEFRFELNAYINSHRATTFTLQSELRSKYKDKFEEWYSTQLKNLTSYEFSSILKELRNINQKEGNKYPTFEFKGETNKMILLYEIDLTNPNYITNQQFIVKVLRRSTKNY